MAPGVAAPAAPPPALADAVRAGRWAEVSAALEQAPPPFTPAVALAAARAARRLGDPAGALRLLERTLPGGGPLSPALRLEAARAAVELGRDPLPLVKPLLPTNAPPAHRRAARELLHDAWWSLPLELLPKPSAALPRTLRRELEAAAAVRGGDAALAAALLRQRTDDLAASEAARFLAGRPGLGTRVALLTAQALLDSGAWREANELLRTVGEPTMVSERARLAFLRGRASYRLGDLAAAGAFFDASLAISADTGTRFAAAVQRARVAELQGELERALLLWDVARKAQGREVEGWDGAVQTRAGLGRGPEAAAILERAPPAVSRVSGPRLAATLLTHGDVSTARRVLARLSPSAPVVRLLALAAGRDEASTTRSRAAALLADPRAGAIRDLAVEFLPPPIDGAPAERVTGAAAVARVAALHGVAAARRAFLAGLRADPRWAALCDGDVAEPSQWTGPAAELVAIGLEVEAATLFAGHFPADSPTELAWSARRLASWGSGPAALAAGERLWGELGGVPAALVPDEILPLLLPEELVSPAAAAAREAGIPPAWLVGTIRRESRFDSHARSLAGAIGIAQFMPETARRHGMDIAALWSPDQALPLAAGELKTLTEMVGVNLVAVTAAYNAGPAVVAAWRKRLGPDASEALFAAAVPYRETAAYVVSVVEGAQLARYLR